MVLKTSEEIIYGRIKQNKIDKENRQEIKPPKSEISSQEIAMNKYLIHTSAPEYTNPNLKDGEELTEDMRNSVIKPISI